MKQTSTKPQTIETAKGKFQSHLKKNMIVVYQKYFHFFLFTHTSTPNCISCTHLNSIYNATLL